MKQEIFLGFELSPTGILANNPEKFLQFLDSGLLPPVSSAECLGKAVTAETHLDILKSATYHKGFTDFRFRYTDPELETALVISSRLFNFSITHICECSRANFFVEKITQVAEKFPVRIAKTYPSYGSADVRNKYFQAPRTQNAAGLCWLQYWGKEEMEAQGGAELLLAGTEYESWRLGEGIMIKVGNSPHEAYTEEGKKKLYAATASLPPVVNQK